MIKRSAENCWEIMSLSESRTPQFRRNELLEGLLTELGSDLQVAEQALVSRYASRSEMPYLLILVMGPLRSGTTLFTQWLANTGLVAYPTNLLSRFYQAPILGAKIQLLLTDPRYNFRDELGEFFRQAEYESENGKTKGVLAPNEFWYFWRRFLADPGRDAWSDDELRSTMDTRTMVAELIGLMDVFRKPFAAKGMLFNYNIPFLNSVFDKILFVQIKRNPISNIASILDARIRQHGDSSAWYSFKIPEYDELINQSPVMQAAAQVHYINKAVEAGMNSIPETRRMVVEYEAFCECPEMVFYGLCDKIGADSEYLGPDSFSVSRNLPTMDTREIRRAIDLFVD